MVHRRHGHCQRQVAKRGTKRIGHAASPNTQAWSGPSPAHSLRRLANCTRKMGDVQQMLPASSSTSFDPTSSVHAAVLSESESAISLQSAQTHSNITDSPSSDPVSRPNSPVTPLPSPPINRISRHKQKRIDSYSQIQIIRQIADDHARMSSDDTTTATTRSTAPPSECGSIESEVSVSKLKLPEPKRRRASHSARSAGERDDGACLLASPPAPLCML